MDRMNVPDEDKGGKYFGASIRMGPFMSVQEDRVSKFYFFSVQDLKILKLFFKYSLPIKRNFKALK